MMNTATELPKHTYQPMLCDRSQEDDGSCSGFGQTPPQPVARFFVLDVGLERRRSAKDDAIAASITSIWTVVTSLHESRGTQIK